MSQKPQPRRLDDHQAKATLRTVRISAQKARLVLDLIRGKKVETALAELTFSTKKAAVFAKQLLESAVANAENNHDLNVDKLYVQEAFADKAIVMKRWRARARGRVAGIIKPTCHMTVVVAEQQAKANASEDK